MSSSLASALGADRLKQQLHDLTLRAHAATRKLRRRRSETRKAPRQALTFVGDFLTDAIPQVLSKVLLLFLLVRSFVHFCLLRLVSCIDSSSLTIEPFHPSSPQVLHEPGELSGWLNRAAASLVGFLSDASSPSKDIPPCVAAELGVFHDSEGKDNGLNLAFSLDLFGVRWSPCVLDSLLM